MLVIVAPVTSSRLVALLAAAWAALAACVSFGAIAFTAAEGARLGVLPVDATHVTLAALASLVVLAIGLQAGRATPVALAVSPLVLLFLPWLPIPVPPVFLLWTGAFASLIWIAVGMALYRVTARSWWPTFDGPGKWPALLPGVLAFAIFSLAAFHASPAIPGGDEPHYLVITQSLLTDGDIKIENNHRRGDYRAYWGGDLPPHVIRRGRNGEMYSIHAPGLPAVVLPAFAVGGYHGVVIFLLLIASAACALAWWLAWRITGSARAAWFGWAAVTFAAPFLLESYTVFPDAPGAAIVLTGFWALLRADWERADSRSVDRVAGSWVPWLLHGAALAMLPWLHTRFAVLAATLGGLILVRLAHAPNPFAKATAFLAVPAAGALAWMGFFLIVYGTPDPTAPYGGDVGSSLAFLPNGLGGLLFDQGFGVLATAPVFVVALVGLTRTRRLGLEWLVVAIPYLLAVVTFPMWWAGSSGPARFLVPLLLPLAMPAAAVWVACGERPREGSRVESGMQSRGAKAVMVTALVVTAWVSAVMAGGGDGRLGYHTRNDAGMTGAPYLEWANNIIDLPQAFPAFVPLPIGSPLQAREAAARTGFLATLPWALCLGAAGLVIIRIGRSKRPDALVPAAVLTLAVAVMLAVSVVWRMHAAEPVTVTAAQMDALRRIASGRVAVFDLTSHRRLRGAETWTMGIEAPVRRPGRGGPRVLNRPLASFPLLPAGTYLLTARHHGAGDGLLMVGVGNDQFAIAIQPISVFEAGLRIHLPAGARALAIRGDEGARDQLDGMELRPLSLDPAPPAGDMARRAVRYGATVAFFLDDRAFPEPSGFWVGGERDTQVVIAPDDGRATVSLIVRNAPVQNTVTVVRGGRREEIALRPGEERRIDVPSGALVGIRSSAGFRPSEVDPKSRDTRLLGVYVRTVEP